MWKKEKVATANSLMMEAERDRALPAYYSVQLSVHRFPLLVPRGALGLGLVPLLDLQIPGERKREKLILQFTDDLWR
jgi:hypothetical protein